MTEIVERETVVLQQACLSVVRDCTGSIPVKLNKNRIAYGYCPECSFKVGFGREDSNAIIRKYRDSRKAQRQAERHIVRHAKPANTDAPPTPAKAKPLPMPPAANDNAAPAPDRCPIFGT